MAHEVTEEQLSRRPAPHQLVVEQALFKQKHTEFVEGHLGEFVLICRDRVYGFFVTSADAHAAAYSEPNIGLDAPFLVREVQEKPEGQIDTFNLMNIAELAANG